MVRHLFLYCLYFFLVFWGLFCQALIEAIRILKFFLPSVTFHNFYIIFAGQSVALITLTETMRKLSDGNSFTRNLLANSRNMNFQKILKTLNYVRHFSLKKFTHPGQVYFKSTQSPILIPVNNPWKLLWNSSIKIFVASLKLSFIQGWRWAKS